MNKSKQTLDIKRLGANRQPIENIPECLNEEYLQNFILRGENRLNANEDAITFFKYGNWLDKTPKNHELLKKVINNFIPGAGPSGFFWYPTGAYMGWHTNANRPGERFFCTYVEEGEKSFFRFRNPQDDKIYTEWEHKGWNFRRFRVGSKNTDILWHCVYSETERFSFGFYLPS